MYDKKLLLDTCALLWLSSGDKEISSAAKEIIELASIVYISAISAWEISLKEVQKSLRLPLPAEEWFHKVCENHNLTIIPLTVEILIAANKLPWHHKDPADRFIIATAMQEKAVIVTADNRFKAYNIKVII